MDIYEKMKKYQVQARYTKPDRYQRRGPEYVAAVLESAHEDMEKYGFTIIPQHSSVTGDVVAYYGQLPLGERRRPAVKPDRKDD